MTPVESGLPEAAAAIETIAVDATPAEPAEAPGDGDAPGARRRPAAAEPGPAAAEAAPAAPEAPPETAPTARPRPRRQRTTAARAVADAVAPVDTPPPPRPSPERRETASPLVSSIEGQGPPPILDGASGPFAWSAPIPVESGHTDTAADAADASDTHQGSTDARHQLREVQVDRGRPARRRGGSGDPRSVVRGGSERGQPGPRRAHHGVRGGVRDGDLGRGRGEDRNGGAGLGLRPGEAGDRLLAPEALETDEQARLTSLQERINVRFRRPELLREAMTHASWNNERGRPSGPGHDNERLEYLGDAVLELVVGEYLFKRFPGYDEGQLTQLRAALVNTMSLAGFAERLGLGDALLLGKGAAKTGANRLPSLLANAFEALIGAIFLDHGYRVATRVFLQNIGDLADWSDENHKGKLQEVAQEKLSSTPTYRVTAVGGPGHRRMYSADAVVAGEVYGTGTGTTKQAAEQAAARQAVQRLSAKRRRTGPAARAAGAAQKAAEGAAAQPVRVRRRIAEAAAETSTGAGTTRRRRTPAATAEAAVIEPVAGAVGSPAEVSTPVAPPAHGRRRSLLSTLRSAAEALVGRPGRGDEPPLSVPLPLPSPLAEVPEPAAESDAPAVEGEAPGRRPTRRGRRGGRGRRRNGAEAAAATTDAAAEPAVAEVAEPPAATPRTPARARRPRRRPAGTTSEQAAPEAPAPAAAPEAGTPRPRAPRRRSRPGSGTTGAPAPVEHAEPPPAPAAPARARRPRRRPAGGP
ncbi:MAG: ribonuclease III, partial [Chloroflexi bacterium]